MRPRVLKPGEQYAGHRPGIKVLTCTISSKAGEVLDHYCPGWTMGRFVESLIINYHIRQTEREAMAQKVGELLRRKVG